jgi:hypothetical protein
MIHAGDYTPELAASEEISNAARLSFLQHQFSSWQNAGKLLRHEQSAH